MYSYEDRIRAVKLFIKLGRRTAATIRQLGYPTKNSLKGWHLEYERRHDLPAGYVRSRPMYSHEQKTRAVDHYLSHGRCFAATLKALGYPERRTLATWLSELYPESKRRVVGRAGSVSRPPELKKAAVLELCTRKGNAQAIAQRLGVSRPTLYNWKNQLAGPEVPASMKRHKESPPAPQPERAQLERQVESLRRDIRRLQLEHDLLRKANEIIKKAWAST
jgi:transposase-like protein